MPSVLSNYGGNRALAYLLGASGLYLAAHTSDPTATGSLATEVAGMGYQRQGVTFSAASGKTCASTNAQTFASMPACTVTYLAVWDSISAGNMLFSAQLSVPIAVPLSGQLLCSSGDVAISL